MRNIPVFKFAFHSEIRAEVNGGKWLSYTDLRENQMTAVSFWVEIQIEILKILVQRGSTLPAEVKLLKLNEEASTELLKTGCQKKSVTTTFK